MSVNNNNKKPPEGHPTHSSLLKKSNNTTKSIRLTTISTLSNSTKQPSTSSSSLLPPSLSSSSLQKSKYYKYFSPPSPSHSSPSSSIISEINSISSKKSNFPLRSPTSYIHKTRNNYIITTHNKSNADKKIPLAVDSYSDPNLPSTTHSHDSSGNDNNLSPNTVVNDNHNHIIYNDNKVTFKDLCDEDKQKLAKLLNEVAEKQKELRSVEEQRTIYKTQMNDIILKDMEEKLTNALDMLKSYQDKISQQTQDTNQVQFLQGEISKLREQLEEKEKQLLDVSAAHNSDTPNISHSPAASVNKAKGSSPSPSKARRQVVSSPPKSFISRPVSSNGTGSSSVGITTTPSPPQTLKSSPFPLLQSRSSFTQNFTNSPVSTLGNLDSNLIDGSYDLNSPSQTPDKLSAYITKQNTSQIYVPNGANKLDANGRNLFDSILSRPLSPAVGDSFSGKDSFVSTHGAELGIQSNFQATILKPQTPISKYSSSSFLQSEQQFDDMDYSFLTQTELGVSQLHSTTSTNATLPKQSLPSSSSPASKYGFKNSKLAQLSRLLSIQDRKPSQYDDLLRSRNSKTRSFSHDTYSDRDSSDNLTTLRTQKRTFAGLRSPSPSSESDSIAPHSSSSSDEEPSPTKKHVQSSQVKATSSNRNGGNFSGSQNSYDHGYSESDNSVLLGDTYYETSLLDIIDQIERR